MLSPDGIRELVIEPGEILNDQALCTGSLAGGDKVENSLILLDELENVDSDLLRESSGYGLQALKAKQKKKKRAKVLAFFLAAALALIIPITCCFPVRIMSSSGNPAGQE